MDAVRDFAAAGGPVLGICNGFQILCEAGLLPGVLRRNRELDSSAATSRCAWSARRRRSRAASRAGLTIPVKHGEGTGTRTPTAAELEERGQIVLRYEENPNGAVDDVAGVVNEAGNVMGSCRTPSTRSIRCSARVTVR